MKRWRILQRLLFAAALILPFALAGCSGSDGAPGASTGTVSGTVTIANSSPALPVAGATITTDPAVAGTSITTAADGSYSATLPVGVYTLTYEATNFTTQTQTVSVTAAQTVTKDVALAATAPVVVSVDVSGSAAPGATLNATATVTPLDGSTVDNTSFAWSQSNSVTVTFGTADAETTTVVLPDLAAFKTELFNVINTSPLPDTDDPTGNTNEDGTPFQAGLQDRFQVQGVNNFHLEKAGEITLKFTVTTTSGTYSGTAVVNAALPYTTSTGLAQVPNNVPVLVHGKDQASYNYTLTDPSGADATALLDDPTSQNPVFTPTAVGKYTLTETGSATSLDIYSGTWVGALDPALTLAGLDANGQGNPVGSSGCTGCHNGNIAPDKFTPWTKSGHAQIFTQNVNAGGHYSEHCFACHTVGFNTTATNNGIDEQTGYQDMLTAIFNVNGSPAANPLNWKTILTDYPAVAHMANIQCENCHGPSAAPNHTTDQVERARRVSLDSAVCGSCHGEPARHGRYQEWEISGHANFSVAIGEGFDSSGAVRNTCAGCHTGQGALAWFDQLLGGNASRTLTGDTVNALVADGLTPDTVQPQACAVCHDPHDPGTVSSLGNDVKPRIVNDTPLLPGGFKAIGVGDGAICITCHNSRNGEKVAGSGVVGLHEDGDPLFGTLTSYATPHEACQGDVFMGRNAYFVQGVRSAHSNIPNTCTNCHMEEVAAPAELGYPSQTNHTFEANLTICSKCHGELDGAALQASVEEETAQLLDAMTSKALEMALADTTDNPGLVAPDTAAGDTVALSINYRGPSLTITYADGSTATPTIPVDDTFAKAVWNYALIEQDFSKGVHNPSFVHNVLNTTTEKVNAIVVLPPA